MHSGWLRSEPTQGGLTHASTIMPRLMYSVDLLESILADLKKTKSQIVKNNQIILKDCNEFEESVIYHIQKEKIISFAIESLTQIQKQINSLNGINSLPLVIPPTIPIIRTISSQIFSTLPIASQKLCELSSILGGIVVDSATITGAKFDFNQSNQESIRIIDKAKLMVDSKINKLYPNLDSLKIHNTWSF